MRYRAYGSNASRNAGFVGAAVAAVMPDRHRCIRSKDCRSRMARRLRVLDADINRRPDPGDDTPTNIGPLGRNRRTSNRAGLRCSTGPGRACDTGVYRDTRTLSLGAHYAPGTTKQDVLTYYLNAPSYIVRSMIALTGWSAIALLLPRTIGRRGQLLAALGLVFHALVISSVAVDWYLSSEVPFTSSSFGASVVISSLMGALAWTVLTVPTSADDPALGDLGGFLLATVLGITYMNFMAVLVIWYGDIPREEIWFVARDRFPWNGARLCCILAPIRHSGPFPVAVAHSQRTTAFACRGRLRFGWPYLLRYLFDCAAIRGLRSGNGICSRGGNRARRC